MNLKLLINSKWMLLKKEHTKKILPSVTNFPFTATELYFVQNDNI